jgi:hypothetical protein
VSGELSFSFLLPELPDGARRTVVQTGTRQFRLYVDEDRIALPDVVLDRTGGSRSASLVAWLPAQIRTLAASGQDLPAPLGRALDAAWVSSYSERVPVSGPLVLMRDAWIPAAAAFPAFAPGGARASGAGAAAVRVDVSWTVPCDGPRGAEPVYGSVHLEFAPPGEEPVEPEEQADEFLTLRPPVTAGAGRQRFVVVDFGTTASTATLQDASLVDSRLVDPGQSRTLGQVLRELTGPQDGAPPSWDAALDELRRQSLTLPRQDHRTLTGSDALLRLDEPDVADAVLLRLERLREDAGPELRAWLIPRLHAGYLRVVNTPALHQHQLIPVDFPEGTTRTHAPASTIREVPHEAAKPGESEAGRRSRDEPGRSVHDDYGFELGVENTGVVGIKRSLLKYEPTPVEGSDRPVVHLAQHMYDLLVDEAEWLTGDGGEAGPLRADGVVVTYPTTILPQAKQRLETLVRRALGIDDVIMDFDEGLAAGMFFVMRDLSGNQDLGLEALRGAARPVDGDHPAWERIMLVIDIGGGTTDIALLQLTLSDTTQDLSPERFRVSGRNYRLEPKLLGSTGHSQLGGDLLTLQVLYWIKARLIDELAPDDIPGLPLATRVVDQAEENLATIVGPELRAILDEYLPSNTNGSLTEAGLALRRRRFSALWNLAESYKCRLGQARDTDEVALGQSDIDRVLDLEDSHQLGDVKSREAVTSVRLDPADFRRLVRPVLKQVAEMGFELSASTVRRLRQARESAADTPPVLDQIVLSGHTTALTDVRETIASIFDAEDRDGRRVGWNPDALSVESGLYAKQATSIGAAWTQVERDRSGQTGHRRGRADGAGRHSELHIQTHGLFSSLPCDFEILMQAGNRLEVLQAGEPFRELYHGEAFRDLYPEGRPRAGVRSAEWSPLPNELILLRPTSKRRRIQWGGFNLRRAALAAGVETHGTVWDTDRGVQVSYQIEVDERLFPSVLLCYGPPRLLVNGPALDLSRAVPGLEFDERSGRCAVPGRICVSPTGPGEGAARLYELFPPTGRQPGDYLPDLFHDTANAQQSPVPGRIARITTRPAHDVFHFYLDRSVGEPTHLGYLRAPDRVRAGLEDCYHATLDAHGRLRVVPGEVPFVPAHDLREVAALPGRVLSRRMDPGRSDFNSYWDPFNGRH